MFDYCRSWFPYVKEGCWPDCDMLPLGRIGIRSHGGDRMTRFTKDEQRLMMTLWCMFRSPLMFGGDMTYNDDFTLSLMKNRELIEINQNSHAGRELYRKGNEIAWAANGEEDIHYLAQFNIGDHAIEVQTPLSFMGIEKPCVAHELWTGKENTGNIIKSIVPPHGVCLYKIKL